MTRTVDPVLAILWGVVVALLAAAWLARRHAERRLAAATGWPVVMGRILAVEIVVYSQGGYQPQVSYSYVVGGQGYASDRLRPGGTPYFRRRDQAMAAIAPYNPGAPIAVRYNPAKPADCAVELLTWNVATTVILVIAASMAVAAGVATYAILTP